MTSLLSIIKNQIKTNRQKNVISVIINQKLIITTDAVL